jgi:type II secretory pathway component GspD/PulD (secretin)
MKKSLVLVSAIFCTCFLTTVCAIGETASGDEPISLNVDQRPLGEVLAMITKMTGHTFIIDDQWLDMPVSISVKAIPLHKALKFIFSDLSNAIIYKSDGKIKIIVYSETPQKDRGSVSQPAATPPETDTSAATAQESESSQEEASEPQTENSSDTLEEGSAQPGEEQEPAEEQEENPAAGAAEEQSENTEPATN